MSKKTQKTIEELLEENEKLLKEQREKTEKLETQNASLKAQRAANYGEPVIAVLSKILGALPSAEKFKSLCDSIEFHNLVISFFARTDTLPSASEVPNGEAEEGVEGG